MRQVPGWLSVERCLDRAPVSKARVYEAIHANELRHMTPRGACHGYQIKEEDFDLWVESLMSKERA